MEYIAANGKIRGCYRAVLSIFDTGSYSCLTAIASVAKLAPNCLTSIGMALGSSVPLITSWENARNDTVVKYVPDARGCEDRDARRVNQVQAMRKRDREDAHTWSNACLQLVELAVQQAPLCRPSVEYYLLGEFKKLYPGALQQHATKTI